MYDPWTWTKGVRNAREWVDTGQKGLKRRKKWDNFNSIINKIYLKKHCQVHKNGKLHLLSQRHRKKADSLPHGTKWIFKNQKNINFAESTPQVCIKHGVKFYTFRHDTITPHWGINLLWSRLIVFPEVMTWHGDGIKLIPRMSCELLFLICSFKNESFNFLFEMLSQQLPFPLCLPPEEGCPPRALQMATIHSQGHCVEAGGTRRCELYGGLKYKCYFFTFPQYFSNIFSMSL